MGEGEGPHLHEQDLGRTIRDTGEREWGAHRDSEGGWAGWFTHTTGSPAEGFLSLVIQSIGRVAPGGTAAGAARGPPATAYWFCALLVRTIH